ncbi:GtrA family protein [Mycobacterium persicum]|uniref:GtrA family protein n=1 Tax=Mycobacterium persicum TaxID=1487726 RepID=UPI000C07782D|nr:GtrA family protein [Mycobacterium persicum]
MELAGGLVAHTNTAYTNEARKKLRYTAVALVFLPIGQGLIQVLGPWLNSYTIASLLAAAIATVPNFFANKHFVWRVASGKKSAMNLHQQVLVFWTAVMLAVGLATYFTYLVDNAMAGYSRPVHGSVVFLVQVLGFGLVWIGRYLILDRWLFREIRI